MKGTYVVRRTQENDVVDEFLVSWWKRCFEWQAFCTKNQQGGFASLSVRVDADIAIYYWFRGLMGLVQNWRYRIISRLLCFETSSWR